MELRAVELLRSPAIRLVYDELGEVLRREDEARREFRRTVSEDARAEFINGEVVTHVTARDEHTQAVQNLVKLLDTYVALRRLGRVRSEQALTGFSRNDYAPDVCFWGPAKSKRIKRRTLVYPVPDFVAEVLSPSTESTDRGLKFKDYEAHCVSEYWILNPGRRSIEQYVLRCGAYDLVKKHSRGTVRCEAVAGFEMSVRAAFDDATNLAYLRRILAG